MAKQTRKQREASRKLVAASPERSEPEPRVTFSAQELPGMKPMFGMMGKKCRVMVNGEVTSTSMSDGPHSKEQRIEMKLHGAKMMRSRGNGKA